MQIVGNYGYSARSSKAQLTQTYSTTFWSIIDPLGATHVLAQYPNLTSQSWESLDASGISYNANTGVITTSDGTRINSSCGPEDTNGNEICNGVDTVGRTVSTSSSTTDYSGCTGSLAISSAMLVDYVGPNGGTSTFKLCYATMSVIWQYDITDGTNSSKNVSMLQSVVLPGDTAWTFQYSNDGQANLAQITFPTGGTISYTYVNHSGCRNDWSTPYVTSRTVNANDGTGNQMWSYTWNFSVNPQTVTVSDPLGNNTVYSSTSLGGPCSM